MKDDPIIITANYLFIAVIIIILTMIIYHVTGSDERATEYNTYVCATQGYESDCQTRLPSNERLK